MVNSIYSWFCTSSSKNLFVKIVHPGGHVELHDRPILAAELLNRNPKCCVAHPTVFQQPHAIVSPDTTLELGQKYYVVPLGTIRKLQLRYSSNIHQSDHKPEEKDDDQQNESDSICWLMRNKRKNVQKATNGKYVGLHMSSRSSKDSEKKKIRSKKRFGNGGASPARLSLTSINNWHPGIERITEE